MLQSSVGEQRRQRTTLRCSLVPLDHHAALHHPRVQEPADDPQQALVANAPCQTRHQHIVVDPVEEPLQVDIHDDVAAVGNVLSSLGERLVGAPARAEAEARRRECRIEDRLQDLQYRLLHETVHHGGDAE
jgi:hypothetical protein